MARIRSVHPGQWTAGDFLECSPLARLLALAIRNVADDHGVFRWKPKSLKAECLPADNCDIGQLLGELISNDQVKKYAIDGKEYGLIVDFTQWQRPKKPKYLHPVPDWFSTSTEPVENQDDTSSEILPQRKEEGGNSGGVEESAREPEAPRGKSLISEEAFEITSDLLKAMGLASDDPVSVGAPMQIQSWINGGWARDVIVTGVQRGMKSRRGDPPSTFRYFENAIARAHAEFTRDLPKVEFKPAETITVTHGTAKDKSVSAVARRFAEQFESQSSDSIAGNPDAFLRLSQG